MLKEETRLKTLRVKAGYTQAQFAAIAGIPIRSLQHLEQGDRDINGAKAITVYKLAKALNCSYEDLLDLDGE